MTRNAQSRSIPKGGNMTKLNDKFDFAALDLSRIAVIGCPGSGKTTLSNELGRILNRQVAHLDKVLWNPNWEMLPYDERKVIHDGLIAKDNWLIDGMWRSHLPDRFKRATTVIFLDNKRRVSFFRAVKRRIKYRGKQRDDIAEGCLEKLDSDFTKYIWNFRKDVRPLIYSLVDECADVATVILSSPKATKRFVRQLKEFT